jgi:hypothetical protein
MSKIATQVAAISLNANTGAALTVYNTALSGVYATTVFIQANHDITNRIYWGGPSMTTADGQFLTTGNAAAITFDLVYGLNQKIALSSIYLCADTAGNKCRVSYIPYEGG